MIYCNKLVLILCKRNTAAHKIYNVNYATCIRLGQLFFVERLQQQINIAPLNGCIQVSLIISVFYLMEADSTFKNRRRREISLLTDYGTSPIFCTKDTFLQIMLQVQSFVRKTGLITYCTFSNLIRTQI